MVAATLIVDALEIDVVVAYLCAGRRGAVAVENDTANGVQGPHQPRPAFTEERRVLFYGRTQLGCMFCMDPAQGPGNIARQSPKYRHVRESGPSGADGAS